MLKLVEKGAQVHEAEAKRPGRHADKESGKPTNISLVKQHVVQFHIPAVSGQDAKNASVSSKNKAVVVRRTKRIAAGEGGGCDCGNRICASQRAPRFAGKWTNVELVSFCEPLHYSSHSTNLHAVTGQISATYAGAEPKVATSLVNLSRLR